MKGSPLIPAAALWLLLTSGSLLAEELPFQAPGTAAAQEGMVLLHQAARALGELSHGRERLSDLWLFPSAEPNTIFARYYTPAGRPGAAPAAHLAVLRLDGARVVQLQELTAARPVPWPDEPGAPQLPWYRVNTEPAGVPGTPHWTALIGTGHATGPTAAAPNTPSPGPQTEAPRGMPYWTWAIGTGQAAQLHDGLGTRVARRPSHTREIAMDLKKGAQVSP